MIHLLVGLALAGEGNLDNPAFSAGSYGRVQASTDTAGGGGEALNIATHGPRLELGPYLELDLGWEAEAKDGATFNVLVTPALAGDLFHYDGNFGDDLSLRNLYASAKDFAPVPLEVWAGSRMYRGDDIYLLDFWPLDNLNTYGAGARVEEGAFDVALHVGMNRLEGSNWQRQEYNVATPGSVEGESVLFLDRQRTVSSGKAAAHVESGDITVRFKVYGEVHKVPGGEQVLDEPFAELRTQRLPPDRGSVVGGQVSAWGWAPQSFVHVWVRRDTGLATYGELSIPAEGLDLDLSAREARGWMFATAGNTETKHVGVMAAGYASSRQDADGFERDFDDRWEVVGVLRPQVYFTSHLVLGTELSHQWVRPNGLNPRTGRHDKPDVTKISVIPAVQTKRGGYSRPRIHTVYTATFLDEEARAFFHPSDARVSAGTQHFVGLGAEWWLNSKRVITPQQTR